jgi:hypothetical protein
MPYVVDFVNVSTVGLDSSPVAEALAGLRANEARYFKNKYDHVFTVSPASEEPEALAWLSRILADERGIVISARPLEVKLSEGMEVPEELASRFKFARQKSKLAGVIRGSFFVIKGEY